MNRNPFEASSLTVGIESDGQCSTRSLWRAYYVAPAVAPLSFVVALFLFGMFATLWEVEINPASFLVLPALALTVGMGICYLVAGLIGMPIAFYLRRQQRLTGFTIHLAAFCWCIFFALVVGLPLSVANAAPWYVAPALIAGFTTPFVLLSATCFWLLVRRSDRMIASATPST